jgi:hypothetical protein
VRWLSAALSLALLGAIAGCSREPEAVHIDLSRIAAERSFPAPEAKPLTPPRPMPAARRSVAPVPPQELLLGASEERLQAVLDAIAENRRATEATIRRRLERVYLADVARLRDQRRRALEPAHQALLDDAYLRLREVFERHAESRFRPQVELALRVGWPDPDPDSRQPTAPRVAELRRVLKEIDRDYRLERDALLAATLAVIDGELGALQAGMARLEAEALDRAGREAQERARAGEIGALAQAPVPAGLRLPALPEVTTRVPAQGQPIGPPRIEAPDLAATDRAMLEAELRIFLAHMGYRLASGPDAGRDATQEFIRWRTEFQPGR